MPYDGEVDGHYDEGQRSRYRETVSAVDRWELDTDSENVERSLERLAEGLLRD